MKNKDKIEKIRHSLAHLMAMAVLEIFPGTKLGIGPVIENGFYYDFDLPENLVPELLPKIEKRMRELIKSDLLFEKEIIDFAKAKKIFKNELYKLELIKDLNKEKKKIIVYTTSEQSKNKEKNKKFQVPPKQSLRDVTGQASFQPTADQPQADQFQDLCAGPHIKFTKEINPDAFKITKMAGAYWRGDEKNKMLTRIYGVAFEIKEELDDHLRLLEEIEKRDHRKLGKELDLFVFSEKVGMGLPLWLPKGTIIRDELEKWAKETEKKWGYQHVVTPHITKSDLYKISGHLPYFKDDLYSPIEIEGDEYYLKPMNCPHTHMIYDARKRSYRELPLRLAEYGQVYRFERSGTLHGLMRVRGFCQNDAHIYVQPEKAVEEFVSVIKMHEYYYKTLGINNWRVVLGIRDRKNIKAKYHGDNAMWEKAEKLSKEALKKSGVNYEIEEGGAAHYGPKADIYISSVIGKEYAIGTDQLDLYMPERFKLTYTDKDGKEKMPYVIHRAPLGSHERMVGFLIEHYAGAFPVWLSPVQARIIPISEKFNKYGIEILEKFKQSDIRTESDDSNETLGKKIREGENQKIPYLLIVGEKEMNNKTVGVRIHKKGNVGEMKINEFLEKIKNEINNKIII